MADVDAEIEALAKRIEALRAELRALATDDLESKTQPLARKSDGKVSECSLSRRRDLNGHFGKIHAMQWSPSPGNMLVSASQDGKLIVWDAYRQHKMCAIPMQSIWVLTCAYSASKRFVASGGLDNVVSIFRTPDRSTGDYTQNITQTLEGHDGYISCCRFLDDTKMLSSSGDATCMLWDISSAKPVSLFGDHSKDVTHLCALEGKGSSLFLSSSVDKTVILWDTRAKSRVMTITGHSRDVNCVDAFPDGNAFATASDDGTCRIYDIRAFKQLQILQSRGKVSSVSSVACSKSGAFVFAGYSDNCAHVYDTFSGSLVQTLAFHQNRISCLGVNYSGTALCIGSWDASLSVWAK